MPLTDEERQQIRQAEYRAAEAGKPILGKANWKPTDTGVRDAPRTPTGHRRQSQMSVERKLAIAAFVVAGAFWAGGISYAMSGDWIGFVGGAMSGFFSFVFGIIAQENEIGRQRRG